MMIFHTALYVAAVLVSVVLIRIALGLLKNGAQRISDGVVARRVMSERARIQNTLQNVIRDNLYCYRCNSRVTVDNCTSWDEDGNVWCDCNGRAPLAPKKDTTHDQ